jgi:20S proteasome alpha/beta subunit
VTLIIGVRCTDGVVLAADSAATMGGGGVTTVQQRTARKLYLCNQNRIIVGVAGYVGLAQRLQAVIEDGFGKNHYSGRNEVAVGKMRDDLVGIVKPEWEMGQIVARAQGHPGATLYANHSMVVAITLNREPQLISFTETCSPEIATQGLPFVCIGSGQPRADPFMSFLRRVFWPVNAYPTIPDGILSAYWTLRHVIEIDPGGVGGDCQLVVLEKAGSEFKARELSHAELETHEESRKGFEEEIKKWRDQFTATPPGDSPAAPPA